jgi:hypothetical protein
MVRINPAYRRSAVRAANDNERARASNRRWQARRSHVPLTHVIAAWAGRLYGSAQWYEDRWKKPKSNSGASLYSLYGAQSQYRS